MTVVGIGTQDSLADAKKFVAKHKVTSARMYWDSGFASWDHFGVAGQPAAILMDASGTVVGSWSGFLDTAKVLAAVRSIPAPTQK